MDIKTILKVIAQILIIIADNIPVAEAVSQTAKKMGLSESDVWAAWN